MEKYISKYEYNEYNLALNKRMLAFHKFIGVDGHQFIGKPLAKHQEFFSSWVFFNILFITL